MYVVVPSVVIHVLCTLTPALNPSDVVLSQHVYVGAYSRWGEG